MTVSWMRGHHGVDGSTYNAGIARAQDASPETLCAVFSFFWGGFSFASMFSWKQTFPGCSELLGVRIVTSTSFGANDGEQILHTILVQLPRS